MARKASKNALKSGETTPSVKPRVIVSSNKRPMGRVFKLIIAVIVLFGVIGLVWFWFLRGDPPAPEQPATQPEKTHAQLMEEVTLPEDISAKDKGIYYFTTAMSFMDTDKQKALSYLLKAEELLPSNKDVAFAIARIYKDLGDGENQAKYEAKAGKKVDEVQADAACDVSEGCPE